MLYANRKIQIINPGFLISDDKVGNHTFYSASRDYFSKEEIQVINQTYVLHSLVQSKYYHNTWFKHIAAPVFLDPLEWSGRTRHDFFFFKYKNSGQAQT